MTKTLVSHVGIAVRDLESAIKSYSVLSGLQNPAIENIESEKVEVAMFSSVGGRIELLAATSDDSPIARFINNRGEGLHHICIYVDDIESKLSELKKAGIKVIDETYRLGAEGKKIAFVHPQNLNGVLIELEER
ncbi:MAG: methylmalonyl-CoA epimerase [candidate division Zixibacteria bacterium]|nr:methylmalonyl-CoA epimerase [candidate division Zixibacteria bacterium]